MLSVKRILVVFIMMAVFCLSVYSISIADFTLQYDKNGRYYNFYDNPAELFELLNEENTLENIKSGHKKYEFDSCSFLISSWDFDEGVIAPGELYQAKTEFGIKNPNHYYNVDFFEAYKDFTTIRGISIGNGISTVIKKYPEAKVYKNNEKYKWEPNDCYHEEKLDNVKDVSDIGYVVLETANWQYNRSSEIDWPMHYELVFVIRNKKVKSIIIQIVLDAI